MQAREADDLTKFRFFQPDRFCAFLFYKFSSRFGFRDMFAALAGLSSSSEEDGSESDDCGSGAPASHTLAGDDNGGGGDGNVNGGSCGTFCALSETLFVP